MGSNGPVRNESMMKHSSFSNSFHIHIPFHHRYLSKKESCCYLECMYGVSERGSLLGIKKDIQSKFRVLN